MKNQNTILTIRAFRQPKVFTVYTYAVILVVYIFFVVVLDFTNKVVFTIKTIYFFLEVVNCAFGLNL